MRRKTQIHKQETTKDKSNLILQLFIQNQIMAPKARSAMDSKKKGSLTKGTSKAGSLTKGSTKGGSLTKGIKKTGSLTKGSSAKGSLTKGTKAMKKKQLPAAKQ